MIFDIKIDRLLRVLAQTEKTVCSKILVFQSTLFTSI